MLDACFVISLLSTTAILLSVNVVVIRSIQLPQVVLRNPDPMIYNGVSSSNGNQCIVNPSRSLSVRSKLECGIICKNDLRCTEWNYWKDTRQCDLYYSVVGNSPATYNVIPGCSSFRDPNPPRGFYFVRCYIEFHQHAA